MIKKLVKFTLILQFVLICNSYLTSKDNQSAIRKVVKQLNTIPLGSHLKQVEKIFFKVDEKYAKLVKIPEGKYEKDIQNAVKDTNALNFVEDYYDQYFTVVNSLDGKSHLSLIYLNDFTLSYYFPIQKWNPAFQSLRFTFFGEELYEINSQLKFKNVQEALVILRELKNLYSEPKIDESEINYRGKNYFLWENKKLKISYLFEPAKNKFSQEVGYHGKIVRTDQKNYFKANAYIKSVKSKLLRLNGIVYPGQ